MATIKDSKKAKNEVATSDNTMNFDFLKNFSLEKFKTVESQKIGAREIYKLSSDLSEDERKTARRK